MNSGNEAGIEVSLVHRFYDRAWNVWDDTVVDSLLAADFVFRGSLGDEVRGRAGWRAYRDNVRAAVPDFHNQIVDLVTSPGRAAARLRYTGHHHGVLLGEQGRGQRIDYGGAAFFTVVDGQLASAWAATSTRSAARSTSTTRPSRYGSPDPTAARTSSSRPRTSGVAAGPGAASCAASIPCPMFPPNRSDAHPR